MTTESNEEKKLIDLSLVERLGLLVLIVGIGISFFLGLTFCIAFPLFED